MSPDTLYDELPDGILATAPAEPEHDVVVLQPLAAGTIFIPDRGEWATGSQMSPERARHWRRRSTVRDHAVLALLQQHRWLTTTDLWRLCWPGAGLRAPRARLRWLTDSGMALRWRQLLPTMPGWRPLPSVWMLTELGAAQAAAVLGRQPKAVIASSKAPAQATAAAKVRHDLAVNAFFTSLAAALAPEPGAGLYHWLSEGALRRQADQEKGLGLRPGSTRAPRGVEDPSRGDQADGWGRVLLPGGRQITCHLEWDQGTEQPLELAWKARGHLDRGSRGEQVLYVLPNRRREDSVRPQLARVGVAAPAGAGRRVDFWTTTWQLLEDEGSLGAVWRGFGESDGERRSLLGLPSRPAPDLDAEHSLGKPGWWNHRPGAGEGM